MASTLSRQLKSVICTYCADVNTPRSLTVALMVKNDEYGQLVSLTVNPLDYTDAESYFKDASVTDFLRKFRDLEIPGVDRRGAASRAFTSSEAQCFRTNRRLSPFIAMGPFESPDDLRLLDFVESVKKEIFDILGPLPQDLYPRFGPGSTFGDKGRLITIPDKMSSRPTITSGARPLLPFFERTAWSRALVRDRPWQSDPLCIRGNRFLTVPKDALKDRGICVEPSINVALQLAVGSHLRRRLFLTGIDLDTSQHIHRSMAQRASLSGELATIDLSNASDTMAYNVIKLLFPSAWFSLLDSLRSPFTLKDKRWIRLEKFSSMGNGFTFELETLLFLALCRAVSRLRGLFPSPDRVRCFGDDIIVPSAIANDVLAVLSWFGFSANKSKTFVSGPFRESCGGDFFEGKAVRPFFLKEDPCEPERIISLANGVRRMALSEPSATNRWPSTIRAWGRCLDMLPRHIRRLRGPEIFGDLVVNDTEERWSCLVKSDHNGSRRLLVWAPVKRPLRLDHFSPSVVLASALYGVPSDGVLSRGTVSGYRTKWVHLDGVSWLPAVSRL